jgi:hypothetical protein
VVNTSQITEGSNLYYTEARVNANFATKTTTDLTEGSNLYFTNVRAVDAVGDEATIDLNSLIVNADSSLAYPWKTLELKADRRTTAPVNNDANDIYWSAKTPNATVSLGLIEIKTDNVTLDGNNDYTVFDNRLDFIVTSMTGGSTSFHNPVSMKKNLINVNTNLNSIDNSFFVGGSYDSLVDSTRIETNSGKWDRSRSGARCKTNATTDATGTTLSQFSDNFATDINLSLNNSEVGAFSIAVLSPDFNGDNTLAYGNGQKSELNMLLRGDGHGVYPETALQALSIQPWDNKVTFNTATGTDNLLLETNAIGFEFDKLVTVTSDATLSQSWKSFIIESDRTNGGAGPNDILWNAKTPNQTDHLGVLEMYINDATTDANGDYTDFNTQFQFWTTSKSAGASSWHKLLTLDKDQIKENTPHVFVNLTTTERNALTAESGMMIFNTTDVKLQCYDGTAWNNLH